MKCQKLAKIDQTFSNKASQESAQNILEQCLEMIKHQKEALLNGVSTFCAFLFLYFCLSTFILFIFGSIVMEFLIFYLLQCFLLIKVD